MVIVGDCLEVLPTLPANSVHSVVTDPPYHLTTGKRGGSGSASLNPNSPAGRSRIGTGFMGKAWDGGDVAFRHETWAEVLRVAMPGAHLVAFGGTRTFHRLACAIEDAGWEIRDTLMWVYGSGFPKSHNGPWGGTALKPAWEPIILARKPLVGTVAANVQRYGTGALNIAGCRIATTEHLGGGAYGTAGARAVSPSLSPTGMNRAGATAGAEFVQPPGRWPANVIHDGSNEVLACFPNAPGQQGDLTGNEPSAPFKNAYGVMGRAPAPLARGDMGSAARFFYCAKASRDDRNEGLDGMPERPLLWSSGDQSPGTFQSENTKRAAQNNHPTVKPTDLMRWLCRLVTPTGGTVLDPFTGSGSTGRGAVAEGFQFVGIELDADYAAMAERRIRATQPGLPLSNPEGDRHAVGE